ncbi:fungal protein kinase-domain containing protein [Phanerochaete sordida]|uniref:Fungal protein kinase-domain containing protein n=1 Tax=Phanerochaete sordida TaxID=48140 RepID=A0A9P3G8N7_9APHY|nr:fungal protein kinase-domain containing protein [Phanerochaete sordida]
MPPRRTTSKPVPPSTAGDSSAGSSSSRQTRPRSDTIRGTPAPAAATSPQLASAQGSRPSQPAQPTPPSRPTTPQPPQGLSGAALSPDADQHPLNEEVNLASDKTTPRKATGGPHNVTPKDIVWVKHAIDGMDDFYAMVEDLLENILKVHLMKQHLGTQKLKLCLKQCKALLSNAKIQDERDVYGVVAEAVNKMFQLLEWNYFLAVTAYRPQDGTDDRKPDLILYRSAKPGQRDRNALYYTPGLENSNEQYHAQSAWAEAIAIAEVKVKPEAAPFNFDDGPLMVPLKGQPLPAGDAKDSRHTRAQMISYVTDVHLHQHRRFLYTAFLQQEHVRFMRWDRSGAIVSKSYDWRKNPEVLLGFFLRLASCTPEERGEDTSVEEQTGRDARTITRKILNISALQYTAGGWLRKYIDRALKDKFHPLVKVECRDIHDPAVTRTYYIARYRAGSHSARGRGTKGYIGFEFESDPEKMRVVFIKDFWYPEGTRTELANYQLLHEKQVPHIATVLAGGDVGGDTPQTTLNQEFFPVDRRPSKRVHTRIVMAEVGRRLETYGDQMELLRCTNHAFQAHKFAYENARLLHRDISAENIMINIVEHTEGFGQGFLNDWDLATLVGGEDLLDATTPSDRSGTWPYMSAPLQMYPRKPNHLSDDLESFVHLLQIFGLRFHRHSSSPVIGDELVFTKEQNRMNTDLADYLRGTYYRAHTKNGYWIGGRQKYINILSGSLVVRYRNSGGPTGCAGPLPVLLKTWYKVFCKHYQTLEEVEQTWEDLWGARKNSTPLSNAQKREVLTCTLLTMTHAEIEDALSEALRFHGPLHENALKTPDQFDELPSADGTVYTRASTGGGSSKALSTYPMED